MRELQAKLAQAEQNARLAIGEGRVQDAEKAMEEVRALRKQIDMLKELEAQEKQEIESSLPKGESKDKAELEQRSEEHTSELQSREKLVCRLLLEKKKQYNEDV